MDFLKDAEKHAILGTEATSSVSTLAEHVTEGGQGRIKPAGEEIPNIEDFPDLIEDKLSAVWASLSPPRPALDCTPLLWLLLAIRMP